MLNPQILIEIFIKKGYPTYEQHGDGMTFINKERNISIGIRRQYNDFKIILDHQNGLKTTTGWIELYLDNKKLKKRTEEQYNQAYEKINGLAQFLRQTEEKLKRDLGVEDENLPNGS